MTLWKRQLSMGAELPYDVAYRCTADENAIVTVLVLQFFFKWNDLLFSMTFISDSALKTVQTGLLYFSDEFGSKNLGCNFASVSMSCIPTSDSVHGTE